MRSREVRRALEEFEALGPRGWDCESKKAVEVRRKLEGRWVFFAWKRAHGWRYPGADPTAYARHKTVAWAKVEQLRRAYWKSVLALCGGTSVRSDLDHLQMTYAKEYEDAVAAPIKGRGGVGQPRKNLPNARLQAEGLCVVATLDTAKCEGVSPRTTERRVVWDLQCHYVRTLRKRREREEAMGRLHRLRDQVVPLVGRRRAANAILGMLHQMSEHLVARIRATTVKEGAASDRVDRGEVEAGND